MTLPLPPPLHADIPTITEVTNTVVLMLWGIAVLARPQTFRASAIYDSLEQLAHPWLWGTIAVTLALLKLAGWLTGYQAVRMAALWLVFCWWLWLVVIVSHAAGLSPGAAVYCFPALVTGREFRSRVFRDHLVRVA